MKIDVRHITAPHMVFEGEEPPEVFDLAEDKFVRPCTPLTYALTVDVVGQEMVVSGQLQAGFEYLCSRCGEFFSTNMKISDFIRSFELESGIEIIDLDPEMREEMILNLPTYPACELGEACPNLERIKKLAAEKFGPGPSDSRWGALDDLTLE
jgi:uncharacterized metal-binding protein YceD (DUF177 family)